MASSSVQRGAARAPPPPGQLASFYKLVDKQVIAGVLYREARYAELSAQALAQAEALFPDDSLVVASLRLSETTALAVMAGEASGVEKDVMRRRAWAILISLNHLLLCRLSTSTLLPGTITEEEMDFEVHLKATLLKAMNKPVPPPAVLRAWASAMGYNTLVLAMVRSLDSLPFPYLPTAQKRSVESFVLQGLDVIPRTAGVLANLIAGENSLVTVIEKHLSPQHHGRTFYTTVLRKWRSDAVSSVLRARGDLQTGVAEREKTIAEFKARKKADVAKHGLRDCALPSCSKTEKSAKEFAGCTGCRSVVYCCLEHQAQDWDAHRQACADVVEHGLRDCALSSCSKTEKTVKEFAGCSGCHSVVYCCLEHQELDWKAHKKACKVKKAERLAVENTNADGACAGEAAA